MHDNYPPGLCDDVWSSMYGLYSGHYFGFSSYCRDIAVPNDKPGYQSGTTSSYLTNTVQKKLCLKALTWVIDQCLKSGATTLKESNDYTNNQLIRNNEINVESTSILEKPVNPSSVACFL
ncbi:hypothetical protein TNCV_142681 [Trichonephila clavipes]|nr:hypothetical protein TNCV_142681 [Trichonephila clavipes]